MPVNRMTRRSATVTPAVPIEPPDLPECTVTGCSSTELVHRGMCDQHACEAGYNTCTECRDWHDVYNMRYVHGDGYCSGCASDRGVFNCQGCNEDFFSGDHHVHDGDSYCPECVPQDDDEDQDPDEDDEVSSSGLIRAYSTRAERILDFKGYEHLPRAAKDKALFMGVELEVEVTSGEKALLAKKTLKALGTDFAILKSDGSINYGFEIVSAPASFEVHKTAWDKFFTEKETGGLANLRSYDTTTCGMHIHLSRAALSTMQISKMSVFLNSSANGPLITAIAGRGNNSYSAISPKKITEIFSIKRQLQYPRITACPDCGSTSFVSAGAFWMCETNGCCQHGVIEPITKNARVSLAGVHPNSSNRHSALNLNPEKTVEIRVFKGTLKRASFLKNIEFAHALVMFTKEAAAMSVKRNHPEAELTSAAFCKWVDNNRKPYPNLYDFLKVKGLIFSSSKPTVQEKLGQLKKSLDDNSAKDTDMTQRAIKKLTAVLAMKGQTQNVSNNLQTSGY